MMVVEDPKAHSKAWCRWVRNTFLPKLKVPQWEVIQNRKH